MLPARMPWPMTLAPMNEAIRRENCAEKNLNSISAMDGHDHPLKN
jgi:hypothetical protein